MGGVVVEQNNFTKGETSPRLRGRTDLEAYYQSVETAINVKNIPQGGLAKRGGFQFAQDLTDSIEGDPVDICRSEPFIFNDTQQAIVIFYEGECAVQRFDSTGLFISDFSYFTTPYNAQEIQELDVVQSADTMIVTHPNHAPRAIVRISTLTYNILIIDLDNIPQFDFRDNFSPIPTAEIQNVAFAGFTAGDTFKLYLEGVATDDITYNGADLTDTAEQIRRELQRLPNTGSDGITTAVGIGTSVDVTFNFSSAKDWKLLTGLTVDGSSNLQDNFITATRAQTGSAQSEPVWSNTRGWPRTCTFHEGRLYFGGSRSRPATIWGSKLNAPFDFDQGRGRDDEGVEFTLLTDQLNAITNILSNRSLQIFTSGAEFSVKTSPITPENFVVSPQTNIGSARVRPVTIEGRTIFLQGGRRALYEAQFDDTVQANTARSLSILAPHLIKKPRQMVIDRAAEGTDANYIYLVNEDGTVTVFNNIDAEGVQAFTQYKFDAYNGRILAAAVVFDALHVIVQIETTTGQGRRTMVLKENADNPLDMADDFFFDKLKGENFLSSANAGGLGGADIVSYTEEPATFFAPLLGGNYVRVPITDAGFGQFPQDGTRFWLGQQFFPKIMTHTPNFQTQSGALRAKKKRILKCDVLSYESAGIIVNGERIPDKKLAQDVFDTTPIEPNGVELTQIYLQGWDDNARIEITQDTPMPMTILSLIQEVKY